MLGIESGVQGEDNEQTGGVVGLDNTFTATKMYDYRDTNPGQSPSYCVGKLNRLTVGDGEAILKSVSDDVVRAVANQGSNYRAIGSTIVLGGLFDGETHNSKKNLLQLYLSFLLAQTEPKFYSSEPEILFGEVDPGETPEIEFFLQNHGENELNITSVELDSDDFVLTGPASADLSFGEAVAYSIQLDPNETGIFNVGIEVQSNDPVNGTIFIPVQATVQYPAEISVPANVTQDVEAGIVNNESFQVENTGEADLVYWARVVGDAINATGGTDTYGYSWWNEEDYPGEISQWNDISSMGSLHSMTGSNTFYPMELPFEFPFYGKLKTQVKIASNGYLTFGEDGIDYSNDEIPNDLNPNDVIAPFWDDLKSNGGALYSYHDVDNQRVIFQYTNWIFYNGTGSLNFQVILYKNGDIEFVYGSMSGNMTSATVGIENSDATDGLQIAYNEPFVESNMSLFISANASYVKLAEPQVKVTASTPYTAHYIVYGDQLTLGQTYNASIEFHSNDPVDSLKIMPITFNVIPVANEEDVYQAISNVKVFPNPFIGNTTRSNLKIAYSLKEESPVDILVYNVKGQQVNKHNIPMQKQGKHVVEFNSNFSQNAASGVYFVKVKTNTQELNRKFLIIK
jgi:hypothetical protein